MSIANGTTHYDYPQVQLNDRPTFADFNPAFADIDSKLYGLITGASTDHAAIEALQTGLGETDTLLASVKNTADSASGKADVNAENITLLQAALGNTDRNVANKLDSVAIAEPYDSSAGTYNVGDIVVYQGQRYKCTTTVAVAEPFDADKWTGEDVQTVFEQINTALNGKVDAKTTADVIVPSTGYTNAQQLAALNSQVDFSKITNYSYIKKGVLFYKINQLIGSNRAEYMAEAIDITNGEFDTYCLVFGSSGNYCWHNFGGTPTNDGATASAADIEFYY